MESHFDAFRRMGQHALRFSNKWMTEPRRTARDFSHYVFAYQLNGADIASAPEAVSQSLYANAIICGRWAMCGFPTINMGHKTAAAFAATKMRPEDAAEFVKPPWPAFCIRLPNGLLQIDDNGVMRDASVIMVTAVDPETIRTEPGITDSFPQPPEQHRWWFKISAANNMEQRPDWFPTRHAGFFDGVALWGYNQATQYLAFPDAGEGELGYRRWETIKTEDSDKRCEKMGRALILSTCMYLSGDPRELSQRAKEGGVAVTERKSKKREGDEFPQYRSFEVTSSIKVNMTETIREYVKHGGSSPTVQTYVQGHWKRVPYGPGATQRKLTHVQAYWRGDLNAPVTSRTK